MLGYGLAGNGSNSGNRVYRAPSIEHPQPRRGDKCLTHRRPRTLAVLAPGC